MIRRWSHLDALKNILTNIPFYQNILSWLTLYVFCKKKNNNNIILHDSQLSYGILYLVPPLKIRIPFKGRSTAILVPFCQHFKVDNGNFVDVKLSKKIKKIQQFKVKTKCQKFWTILTMWSMQNLFCENFVHTDIAQTLYWKWIKWVSFRGW